jgi:rRNA maturation protein Nop10
MKYIDCRRCRARFHTGVIYEPIDRCPRCGGALHRSRPRLREQLRRVVRRRSLGPALDWEAITGSQYARRAGAGAGPDPSGTTPAPAR